MKVIVDPDVCTGHGRCWTNAAAVYTLDENGYNAVMGVPIAVAMSSPGFCRIVSAVALTAFWSRGVKARSACCTRLPSCASTESGMSSGFWVTK